MARGDKNITIINSRECSSDCISGELTCVLFLNCVCEEGLDGIMIHT